MATTKKKHTKKGTGKTAGGKQQPSAFAVFIRSKRFARIRGAVYVLFAFFLAVSMVGYYATGCGAHPHWLGTGGQGLAEFFAQHLFGLGSLGFSLLFFVYGLRLWDIVVLPWWKTFGSTLFWMLWLSLTLGYIGGAWVKDADFEDYAGIGLRLAEPLHVWLRWGTLVLLLR